MFCLYIYRQLVCMRILEAIEKFIVNLASLFAQSILFSLRLQDPIENLPPLHYIDHARASFF